MTKEKTATDDVLSRITVEDNLKISPKLDLKMILKCNDFYTVYEMLKSYDWSTFTDNEWVRINEHLTSLLDKPKYKTKKIYEILGWGLTLLSGGLAMMGILPFYGPIVTGICAGIGLGLESDSVLKRNNADKKINQKKLDYFREEMSLNIGVSTKISRDTRSAEDNAIESSKHEAELNQIKDQVLKIKDIVVLLDDLEIKRTNLQINQILLAYNKDNFLEIMGLLSELYKSVFLKVVNKEDELFLVFLDDYLNKFYGKSEKNMDFFASLRNDLIFLKGFHKDKNNIIDIRFAEFFYAALLDNTLVEAELLAVVSPEFLDVIIRYLETLLGISGTGMVSKEYLWNLIVKAKSQNVGTIALYREING